MEFRDTTVYCGAIDIAPLQWGPHNSTMPCGEGQRLWGWFTLSDIVGRTSLRAKTVFRLTIPPRQSSTASESGTRSYSCLASQD